MAMTILEFSREIGVSTATVWRAVHGAKGISPETRDMVLRRMNELGYQPNQAARALVRGQSEVVSLWMPSLGRRYDGMVISEVQKLASADHYEMLIRDISPDRGQPGSAARLLRWPVDGIIVAHASPWVWGLLRDGMPNCPPIVGIGNFDSVPIDAVRVDLKAGAMDAMHHLLDCGCRRIAFLVAEYFNQETDERRQGYLTACERAGIEPEIIVAAVSSRLAAAQAIEDYVVSRGLPDGLLCFNDDNAIGAFCRLRKMGARVPEDIALVGCDGIEDTLYLERTLSTIAFPMTEMCAMAWHFLRRRMADPDIARQRLVLQPSLIIRESSSGRSLALAEARDA